MHIFVRLTIQIITGFRHAQLCTNDYPYCNGFSSCTSLYEWLSIFLWHFVINMFVLMTIHIRFSSCTPLFEWLSIFLWVFVMHIFVIMTIKFLVFVITIFVRMTIHFSMGFRRSHLCTNEYPYSKGFLSCTCLYEWLSIFGFRHALVCTNDYHCSYWFSSCTSLYEWLSMLVFIMHIFVRLIININMGFRHVHLCTNDYFVPNLFPLHFCKTGIVIS